VKDYYKDATFGVKKKDRATDVKPRKGVTILRDKQYGVPRVYGKTAATPCSAPGTPRPTTGCSSWTCCGTPAARISNFLGGANLNADANQWQNNAYTEDDLKKMLKAPRRAARRSGTKLRKDVDAYVDGINAYIKAARNDPTPCCPVSTPRWARS
jgi:hypothetical protein